VYPVGLHPQLFVILLEVHVSYLYPVALPATVLQTDVVVVVVVAVPV
jgi:hypothetical protein